MLDVVGRTFNAPLRAPDSAAPASSHPSPPSQRVPDGELVYRPSVTERVLQTAEHHQSSLGWIAGAGAMAGLLASRPLSGPGIGRVLGLSIGGAAAAMAGLALLGSTVLRDRVTGLGDQTDVSATPRLSDEVRHELIDLAASTTDRSWDRSWHLDRAVNAHYSNTPNEMRVALSGPYNSLEGDVRIQDGAAVMAHDTSDRRGMTFAEWAQIADASGRMMRIDFKDAWAVDQVLAVLDELGTPDERITFNVSMATEVIPGNMSSASVARLRERFPNAWIAANLPTENTWHIDRIGRAISGVDGKTAIAIQAQQATPERMARMPDGVTVNVWNDPRRFSPDSIADETARLRSLGIGGMIDLRQMGDVFETSHAAG